MPVWHPGGLCFIFSATKGVNSSIRKKAEAGSGGAAFNPITWEAQTGGSLGVRVAWPS